MISGLGDAELERYGRHVMLDAIGIKGQGKLRESAALIVGAGGLGCPAALYLASCGVGTIRIVDDDVVEVSNLQRQILFRDSDTGEPKVKVAARELESINPKVKVEPIELRATKSNLPALCEEASVVLDCSDNFETRHAVNAACHMSRTDLVSGAAEQFDGQLCVLPFSKDSKPCYNCLFPASDDMPEQTPCSLLGVFAPLTGMIGAMMAGEAIRLLASIEGEGLTWRLLAFDTLGQRMRTMKIKQTPGCPVCSGK